MATTMQEFLIGKRERMAWVIETSYASGGNLGTNGEVVGLDVEIQPSFSVGYQESLTAGADNRQVQGRVASAENYPYVMSFNPVNWRWLKYLMGVVDGTDGSVKTHTFTLGNTINSYKIEWAKRATTNHVITLTGSFAKKATLSWQKSSGEGREGKLRVSLDCNAKDKSQGSSVTSISNLTKDPFLFKSVKLTVNSTEIVEVNNGDIVIDNTINEEDSRYANSTADGKLSDPIPKTVRFRLRANVNLKDKTYYDLWANKTPIPGTNTLLFDRDGTGNDQLLLTFSVVTLLSPVAPTSLNGVTNVDLIMLIEGVTGVARDDISAY